jgi:hypothetical protein
MSGHTPPPWSVSIEEEPLHGTISYVINTGSEAHDEAERNANLIYAAPDLLAALAAALPVLADNKSDRPLFDAAVAAIDKAEGQA